MNKEQQATKGFTLIETIITIAIFAFAMVAAASFIITIYKSHAYTFQQSTAINDARKGIEIMVKELREAKMGDDGSYVIEKADDHEIIFYSDIDKDGGVERVRYFVYESDSLTGDCVGYAQGSSCNVNFPDFSSATIDSAQVEICVEGDLNGGNEYVKIFADGDELGTLCQTGCDQCASIWQGCATFDVTEQANNGSILFTADSSAAVGCWGSGFCDWQQENHSVKARFIFSWTETNSEQSATLKKGVINPSEYPIEYPQDQEEISILSQYVKNTLPVFRYFDGNGNELAAPARLGETKLMRVYLLINVNPERAPQYFELESNVQIRNLKTNL
ncbi:MAG: prepilin-type N-terminal cleavage/methylation domain-containing protein [Patescibacteria group bacterium]|nr:prepilin-type N-terminal cleavage/methylation domain-containing protein [Patescibacteria group bacterium]